MKNTMTKELREFVEKLQNVGRDLYDEYNVLNEGLQYTCPLTDIIDALYEFSLVGVNETINEDYYLEEENKERE